MLLALLLAGCECGADDPEPEPTPEPDGPSLTRPSEERPEDGNGEVELRFAWPDGARGRVAGERVLRRSVGADLTATLGYRISVRRAGDETFVDTGALEVAPIRGSEPEVVSAGGVLDMFLPSCVALPDRLDRLADFETSRDLVSSAVEPAVAAEIRGGRAWHLLEPLWTERNAMMRATLSKWDWLVTGNVGQTMQLGETGELSGTSQTALTAEAVQTTGELTAVGRTPCFDGDEGERCVYIVSSTQMDEAGAAAMGASLEVEGFAMTMRSVLVTEVDTLLPHYAQMTAVRSFSVGEGDDAEEVRETDTKTFRFQWESDSIRSN